MHGRFKFFGWVVVVLLATGIGVAGFIFWERHEGDDDHHHRKYAQVRGHDRERHEGAEVEVSRSPVPPRNEPYKSNCGDCHLAYPPELLPSDSWQRILTRVEDHFGEALSLDNLSRGEIGKYLAENAADRSKTEIAGKVLRNLGGLAPVRITEVPYIQRKHRKISPEVFRRKSVGSFSNCLACHQGAEQGNFDDKGVVIPR